MDERRAIRIIVTILCLLWVSAAEAAPESQEFFSGFEEFDPNTVPGVPFDIGSPPDLATFGGDAFAGFLATPLLYRTGIRSWMVQANGLGTIDFPMIAAEVEFYAVVLSGATSATFVTAFDPLDQQIGPTFVIDPGAGFQLVRFVGPVASIDVENPAGQMNAVDDFGFTSLPEPGLAPAAMAGAALLVQLRGRRAQKAAADGSPRDRIRGWPRSRCAATGAAQCGSGRISCESLPACDARSLVSALKTS